jgi:hypothetical protein
MLYWQRTYFWAADGKCQVPRRGLLLNGIGDLLMTPFMRAAMRSTIAGFEGFLDLTSMAVLETTVSMALRPAAFMVSPDSVDVSLV